MQEKAQKSLKEKGKFSEEDLLEGREAKVHYKVSPFLKIPRNLKLKDCVKIFFHLIIHG
jgi:hypothetical protein